MLKNENGDSYEYAMKSQLNKNADRTSAFKGRDFFVKFDLFEKKSQKPQLFPWKTTFIWLRSF